MGLGGGIEAVSACVVFVFTLASLWRTHEQLGHSRPWDALLSCVPLTDGEQGREEKTKLCLSM